MATTYTLLQTAVQNNALSSDATAAGAAINDGYIDVCERFFLGATSVSKTLTAGTTTYNLTSAFSLNVLKILDLRYVQSGSTFAVPMQLVGLQDVNDLNQAGVQGYIHSYAWLSEDSIVVGPAPATGDQLTFYYVPRPTALSAGSDVPSAIPSAWQFRLLSYYGSWMLAEGESAELAEQYHAKYLQALDDFTAWLNRRQGGSSKGMRAGYPDRPNYPPHDRSTYWTGMNL